MLSDRKRDTVWGMLWAIAFAVILVTLAVWAFPAAPDCQYFGDPPVVIDRTVIVRHDFAAGEFTVRGGIDYMSDGSKRNWRTR